MTTTSSPAPAPLSPAGARALLPGVSIVLACCDEAGDVAAAIRSATAAGERTATAHEIIVIADGSAGETAQIARRFADRDRRVRPIVHAGGLGYAAALRSGIRAADLPWILLTGRDLRFDLADLEDLLPYADGADVLVGWRLRPRGRFVRRLLRRAERDGDCAFKLLRADVIRSLPRDADGALLSTEQLVRAIAAAGGRLRVLARVEGRR